MKKVAREILELSLEELLEGSVPTDTVPYIRFPEAAGIRRSYSITAPDSLDGSITFSSVELLKRFADLTYAAKVSFMTAVRKMMEEKRINILEIAVPWYPNGGEKTIRVVGHYSKLAHFQFHMV